MRVARTGAAPFISRTSRLTMDITVDTMLDNIAEGDETFLLEITAVSGPGMEGFPADTVITIDDDDIVSSLLLKIFFADVMYRLVTNCDINTIFTIIIIFPGCVVYTYVSSMYMYVSTVINIILNLYMSRSEVT